MIYVSSPGGEEEGLSRQGVGVHKLLLSAVGGGKAGDSCRRQHADMIGTLNTSTRSVMLEGAPLSQQVLNGLAAAATYTQLTVETSLNPFASDCVPFINAGNPSRTYY